MNTEQLFSTIDSFWDLYITPTLKEYIKIPNKSPSFDPNWEENGHMNKVVDLAVEWTNKHKPKNSTLSVKQSKKRTPIILLDIPGDKGWTLNATITAGYPLGKWGVATRKPVEEVTFLNKWGESPDWNLNEPLWNY